MQKTEKKAETEVLRGLFTDRRRSGHVLWCATAATRRMSPVAELHFYPTFPLFLGAGMKSQYTQNTPISSAWPEYASGGL